MEKLEFRSTIFYRLTTVRAGRWKITGRPHGEIRNETRVILRRRRRIRPFSVLTDLKT